MLPLRGHGGCNPRPAGLQAQLLTPLRGFGRQVRRRGEQVFIQRNMHNARHIHTAKAGLKFGNGRASQIDAAASSRRAIRGGAHPPGHGPFRPGGAQATQNRPGFRLFFRQHNQQRGKTQQALPQNSPPIMVKPGIISRVLDALRAGYFRGQVYKAPLFRAQVQRVHKLARHCRALRHRARPWPGSIRWCCRQG